MKYPQKIIDRFNKSFSVNKKTDCWEWILSKYKKGYGVFRINQKSFRAHRISFIIFKGKIPEGLQLDHLCRNRACVNPKHLEAVTNAENSRRGKSTKLNKNDIEKIWEMKEWFFLDAQEFLKKRDVLDLLK